jgi:capsular polysaccharide biosynthesis protein
MTGQAPTSTTRADLGAFRPRGGRRLRRVARRLSRPLRRQVSRVSRARGFTPWDLGLVRRLPLDDLSGARVVLLADGDSARLLAYRRRYARSDVHVISGTPPVGSPALTQPAGRGRECDADPATTARWLSRELAAVAPVSLIVNLRRADDAAHVAMWERAFLHLRPGGHYAAPHDPITRAGADDGLEARLAHLQATRPAKSRDRLKRQTQLEQTASDAELSRALGAWESGRWGVVAAKRGWHYYKLREADAHLLATRRPRTRVVVLSTKPDGTLASASTVTSHPESVDPPVIGTTFDHPPLFLREYTGSLYVLGRNRVVAGRALVPDSFRWALSPDLVATACTNLTPEFARIEGPLPRERLPGSYYLLDSVHEGHFGHFLTEVVPKLWGWDAAKAAHPELKVLLHRRHPGREPRLETRFFSAYGIDPADVVTIDEPVRVDRVVTATTMSHNASWYPVPEQSYVHPEIELIWDRLLGGMKPTPSAGSDKILVSRSEAYRNRSCRNIGAVEDTFRRHGFDVVYPELLTLEEQAGLFRDPRVVAGFSGSGMFNLLYARRRPTVIVLAHTSYTARNEHLIAMVKGCPIHYYWSAADRDHPAGGFAMGAFMSGWAFDFERNGAALDELLSGLD